MRFAIAFNSLTQGPTTLTPPNHIHPFGIDSPEEVVCTNVRLVEADSEMQAINKTLPFCPNFSEDNTVEEVVKWLGLHDIVVSVPVLLKEQNG